MNIDGEEERKNREDEEVKEVHNSILKYSPCLAFQKLVQIILKCLGLESSPSSSSSSSSSSSLVEEHYSDTQTVENTGFMARITAILRRRPRPPYSSGRPGQNN